ncbi:MAG: Gfo/Idh/MocA family oxidoreductase, partial [Anaerolineae bacterium]|nr:Gfo/Idh/MocA family oxidoreductase [Anaerolineae bacterium]
MALRKRVVVVGAGSIGRRHARLLGEREDLVVELCEPNDDALQRAWAEVGKLTAYRSYGDALAAKPDMVVIATPHQWHCSQTLEALRQGIHVLCEKPMSDTLGDAVRMRAAAEESEAILSIGFMLHF